jgi:hypothetical protein
LKIFDLSRREDHNHDQSTIIVVFEVVGSKNQGIVQGTGSSQANGVVGFRLRKRKVTVRKKEATGKKRRNLSDLL